MAITVGAVVQAHDRNIKQRARLFGCQWEPTMRVSITNAVRKASFALVLAVSISALSSSASLAFSSEAQQMCTGDAFRLCSSEIPNIPKITACMYKHRSELSGGCRAVMDRDLAKGGRKVVAEQ
jgi:hypothetical protein